KAEAITQRTGEHARASGCSNKGKRGNFQRNGCCTGSFAHNDDDAEVFHRHVQHFLGRTRDTGNFIDEKDVTFHQVRYQRGPVTASVQRLARAPSLHRAHSLCNVHLQGWLTKSWAFRGPHVASNNTSSFCSPEN